MGRIERDAAIVALYQSGMSQEAVARHVAIGVWSVRKALELAGAFPTKEEAERRRLAACTSPEARAKRANALRRPLEQRFYGKVDISGGCWLWHGAKDTKGYGQLRIDGKTRVATHIALELAGKPRQPDKPCALHHCDNPPCVNPAHLFWGTMRDNTRDMMMKGRQNQDGLQLGHERARASKLRPMVECAKCGVTFETRKAQAQQNHRNFCSRECCWSWQSSRFTGTARSSWAA